MSSLISFFKEKVKQYPNNDLLWEKLDQIYHSTSYTEGLELVKKIALGLQKIGLKKEDKVALQSEGRNLWLLSELAVLSNRAITVPLSTKLEADNDLLFRIDHSESKYMLVSENQLTKIRTLKSKLPLLEYIIVFNPTLQLEEGEIDINEIINKGEIELNKFPLAYEHLSNEVKPDDIATITYTSGTTAQPKGIMLSHRNYTANVEQAFSYIDIPEHFRTLVVLPWDHAFAHTASLYSFMMKGASIASVQIGKTPIETLKNFSNNIKEIQPHILMSVPALAKNFKSNIEKGIAAKGNTINSLFKFALKLSYWHNGNGEDKGKGLSIIAKPLLAIFNQILFKKVKIGFGGNLQFFIGGGALLDYDLQQFFYAIGIPMYQGYGLSEASPIISANTPNFHRLGSSGKILHNLEVKICDENGNKLPNLSLGEIVVKGENVMQGYWKNQQATNETIKDNWLYTGDLGYLDDTDFLYVRGRYKSLLISADGEKYSPEGIEETIIDNCSFIHQIMLYNNQNAFTTAIIVPNVDLVKAKNLSPQEAIQNINNELSYFKKGGKFEGMFPQRWLPSNFAIAHQIFSEENKLINSTMKLVRDKVIELFDSELKTCYTAIGRDINNKLNVENLMKLLNT